MTQQEAVKQNSLTQEGYHLATLLDTCRQRYTKFAQNCGWLVQNRFHMTVARM